MNTLSMGPQKRNMGFLCRAQNTTARLYERLINQENGPNLSSQFGCMVTPAGSNAYVFQALYFVERFNGSPGR